MTNTQFCLLPVAEFRVTYFVAKGRPWSPLEWFVLRAVSDGARTVHDLRRIFQVHQRLLIEALVTLTMEGWLATSSEKNEEFVLSPSGVQAVRKNRRPKSHLREPQEQSAVIIQERLTGGLYTSAVARTYSAWDVQEDPTWISAQQLDPDPIISDEAPEVTRIAPLLSLRKGEWIDSPIRIGPEGSIRWMKVEVNPHTGELAGAERLAADLRIAILQSAGVAVPVEPSRVRPSALPQLPGGRGASRPRAVWPARVLREDLLTSEDEHVQYLKHALTDSKSVVFVASAFVSEGSISALRGQLEDAVGRGVQVELVGGYASFEGRSLSAVQTLTPNTAELSGSLYYNRNRMSGSHAKFVIWDHSDEQLEACVGSFNWLSADPSERRGHPGSNVSLVVREPALISELARYAATLIASADADAAARSSRWEERSRTQASLQGSTPNEGANAQLQLLFDRDHDSLFRSWVVGSERRFLVASHKMGNPTASRFFPGLMRSSPIQVCRVLYGELLQPELAEVTRGVQDTLDKMGALQTHASWLHSKVLISDGRACVSSYNFLSAGQNTAKTQRELGIVIEPLPSIESNRGEGDSGISSLEDAASDVDDLITDPDAIALQRMEMDMSAEPPIDAASGSVELQGEPAVVPNLVESSVDSVAALSRCEPVEWLWEVFNSANPTSALR